MTSRIHGSIPRLELAAAVVLAELIAFICEEMKVKFSWRILWMDSSVSPYQIKNRITRQKAFVANRVSKIHELTLSEEWRWTPVMVNCADYCFRGIEADDWESWRQFHNGSDFIKQDAEFWPVLSDNLLREGENVCTAFYEVVKPVETSEPKMTFLSRMGRHFSSWSRLLHRVAWL